MSRVGRWSGPLFEGHIPSLGYTLIDWYEEYCCHGPGDVQGMPLDLDDEIREFIIECYRLDPITGRRVYREAILSRPKGRAKSEIAGIVGVGEALGPCRFDGWDADGQPVGRPVVSPFIRCLATEESQAGNTFENISYIMSEWGPDVHPQLYGGIKGARTYQSASALYLPNGGEIRVSTSGAASKDGGKETFVVPDESHLYVARELREMYGTVMRNMGKRKNAEPWALQTTTAYFIGENSIAERKLTSWRKGTLGKDIYVNHREASGDIKVRDRNHTIAQLREVYGVAMGPNGWMDPEVVYSIMTDPESCKDEETAARYYLNRAVASNDAWISRIDYDKQIKPREVALDEPITIGFDGSLNDDSTVIRGCCMSDGYRFTLGMWEKPEGAKGEGWEVPRKEVLDELHNILKNRNVVKAYMDLHEWRSDIASLALEYGEKVVGFATGQWVQMGKAFDLLHTDLRNGETFHDDDARAATHYYNAMVWRTHGQRLARKDRDGSSRKIDTVYADGLAYRARHDAFEAGWSAVPKKTRVIHFR